MKTALLLLLVLTGCPFMTPPPEPVVSIVVKERVVFVGVMAECAVPVIALPARKD
jgi:hypothetical protein